MTRVPGLASAPTPRAAHGSLSECEHALSESERHLVDLRTRLWETLPLEEKFAASAPDPAAEAPLRSELTRLFAVPELAGAEWTLECRGSTCQLQIVSNDAQRGLWMDRLQTDEALRKQTREMSFHARHPTNDQGSGAPVSENQVYLRTAEAGVDQLGGQKFLETLWTSFKASSAPGECAALLEPSQRAGDRTLLIQLDVNVDGAGVHSFVGGVLGATRAGRCVAERLAAHATAAPAVTPDLPKAVLYLGLELAP